MNFDGIRLVGLNAENGRKLLLTVALIVAVILARWILRAIARLLIRGNAQLWRGRFWTHQAISVVCAILLTIGLLSIWFDDPGRLGTFVGLLTAGVAIALQKVITSLAGYFVVLRGNTFSVGDRIVMGDVRGDVLALGFMQTTIMEMGQPPPVQAANPAMWVHSRQFTGRIVTISNSEIFDKPVYNYSREFPYIWDEIQIPISYEADRAKAESILLAAANRHALNREKLGQEPVEQLHRKYQVEPIDLDPTVYYRLTDNWIELTVRFMAPDHGIRRLKDSVSREIISELEQAGIGIASTTYAIVAVPPIKIANGFNANNSKRNHSLAQTPT
ncbi:MAG TPA: mechanosensitive ion channel family protein [Chthoniobacterales bacterium]|nr:mechanosensitive ion channel family protein [Chthoniobacterales bacterium]